MGGYSLSLWQRQELFEGPVFQIGLALAWRWWPAEALACLLGLSLLLAGRGLAMH